MKQSKGFSAPLLIAVIIFLLAIGFIAWRIFAHNQPSRNNASSQQQTQINHSQTQTDPNAGYVVLKEWGVRFKPASSLKDVQYTIGDRTPSVDGTAVFSTVALSSYSESCSANQDGKAPLGLLTRTKTVKDEFNSESGAFVKKIGDYYYQYVTPQAACADDPSQIPAVPLAEFKNSIATLEAAK